MATTTVQVADHMVVTYQGLTAVQDPPNRTTAGTLEANVTQHVSMTGANSVSLQVSLNAVNGAAANVVPGVEFILEQSNDRSNWFEVDFANRNSSNRTQFIKVVGGNPTQADWKNLVTMAWVRVTFLITSYAGVALTAGDTAVVSCTLSTSLN
jgi:hypothetical protein